jgi:hypothetical protein
MSRPGNNNDARAGDRPSQGLARDARRHEIALAKH